MGKARPKSRVSYQKIPGGHIWQYSSVYDSRNDKKNKQIGGRRNSYRTNRKEGFGEAKEGYESMQKGYRGTAREMGNRRKGGKGKNNMGKIKSRGGKGNLKWNKKQIGQARDLTENQAGIITPKYSASKETTTSVPLTTTRDNLPVREHMMNVFNKLRETYPFINPIAPILQRAPQAEQPTTTQPPRLAGADQFAPDIDAQRRREIEAATNSVMNSRPDEDEEIQEQQTTTQRVELGEAVGAADSDNLDVENVQESGKSAAMAWEEYIGGSTEAPVEPYIPSSSTKSQVVTDAPEHPTSTVPPTPRVTDAVSTTIPPKVSITDDAMVTGSHTEVTSKVTSKAPKGTPVHPGSDSPVKAVEQELVDGNPATVPTESQTVQPTTPGALLPSNTGKQMREVWKLLQQPRGKPSFFNAMACR